jgi:hypothetical protein
MYEKVDEVPWNLVELCTGHKTPCAGFLAKHEHYMAAYILVEGKPFCLSCWVAYTRDLRWQIHTVKKVVN